jgi:hypothetical protein
VSVSLGASKHGIHPRIEYSSTFYETSKKNRTFSFGPRLGYSWDVFGGQDHFYLQNIVEYRGVFVSPFWLRSYNKAVGYQVPFSVGYRRGDFEVWGNYVYHAKSFDIHLMMYIRKYGNKSNKN